MVYPTGSIRPGSFVTAQHDNSSQNKTSGSGKKDQNHDQGIQQPDLPAPSYESLFPEARIPRPLFDLGEKFGGPQMLSKANESSSPSPVAKVYEDLFDVINSWDKLTVFVDDSGSMHGKGSIVYFPGLGVDPANPSRFGEGETLMNHLLDFIIAARDPKRPLPIEMVSIHNCLGEENTDPHRLEVCNISSPQDLKTFMQQHNSGGGTPMGQCIRAYKDKALMNEQGNALKRKFMALGDGEDNRDTNRKLAQSVVSLWKEFNATVTLFPLTPSGGKGLKWMNTSDTASPAGKVDATDDFISEYIQILKTSVKNQYGRLSPQRDQAIKEINAIEKQFQKIETDLKQSQGFYYGHRQNPLLEVPRLFERLQEIELKYELRTKDSRGCYTPFDYFAKALLSEIPKYDLADERNSKTHKVMTAMSRGFNGLMV